MSNECNRKIRLLFDDCCPWLLLCVSMKLLVVVVGDRDVAAPADDANGVRDDMNLRAGGQPEFVIDELLVEGEGASFADAE